jgi:hypothetical protein
VDLAFLEKKFQNKKYERPSVERVLRSDLNST